MIDPISIGPASATSAISGADGQGGTPASIAGDSARTIARSVVGSIASELMLAPPRVGNVAENYGVRALADTVAARFPDARPAAIGDLSRAMEGFAGAVAADMAGLADGRTLDRVDSAISAFEPQGSSRGIESVTTFLEQATRTVNDAR